MKKYWIKDLNENQVIHAPTKKIAKKLCNKFHELDLKWCTGESYSIYSRWDDRAETCYSPSKGMFCDLSYSTEEGYEILTIDQLLDFQSNEYPKVMEVSHEGFKWYKRVVFMKKNESFLAWINAESIEESEKETQPIVWKFAREIQPTKTLELTIDQIADKFGVSVEQIKIKK